MKALLRKYCSVLFLFAFLFPQIEQQIHAFEHLDDFHCSSADKHFHKSEHKCDLCDFSIPDNTEPAKADLKFVQYSSNFAYKNDYRFCFSETKLNLLPARAPPVI